MKKWFKYGILIFVIILLIAAYLANMIWGANTPNQLEDDILFIENGSSVDQLADDLVSRKLIKNKTSFTTVARLMKYTDAGIKTGRYQINPGASNRELIKQLRIGRQAAVKLTFNNVRTIEELSGNISNQLQLDSLAILEFLSKDENLNTWNTDLDNVIHLFIPNTYEIYWNVSLHQLMQRMIKEHKAFWNDKRTARLDELNMTQSEAYTLASIVQKETLKSDEKPRVAGVYINRLQRNIPLQADPTVVFAIKKFDLKRVLNKHLRYDSPFNTYIYEGLPPGPICMPDADAIDAVLDFEKHRYLYFCAKPDYSGYHNFAKNLIQHNKNAKQYHRWLNKQRIK